jgi:hypothetical protein
MKTKGNDSVEKLHLRECSVEVQPLCNL